MKIIMDAKITIFFRLEEKTIYLTYKMYILKGILYNVKCDLTESKTIPEAGKYHWIQRIFMEKGVKEFHNKSVMVNGMTYFF